MIGWMQRKRKYLIVTIWVSTIAFVGAGFVGWGSYSMSKSSDILALVDGDYEVTNQDFNQEYNRLFDMNNRNFGGRLTQDLAKQLKLDQTALNNVINQKLIIAYANELGFYPLKREIVDVIRKQEAFYKNGKFDEKTYYDKLNSVNINPKKFESNIAESVLVKKITDMLVITNSALENNAVDLYYGMEDLLKVKVISSKNIKINDKSLKEFFEKNKENYQTDPSRDIGIVEVPYPTVKSSKKELLAMFNKTKHQYRKSDGKLENFEDVKDNVQKDINYRSARDKANKIFYDFKKNKIQATKTLTISLNDSRYSEITLSAIFENKVGSFVKPMAEDKSIIIAHILSHISPRVKTFKEAKREVKDDFTKYTKSEGLINESKVSLKSADFKLIDYVSMNNLKPIEKLGFSDESSLKFARHLFSSTSKSGYFILGDKSILYKIVKQRYRNSSKLTKLKDIDDITAAAKQYSDSRNLYFQNAFIDKLRAKYEVISYVR